MNKGKAKSIFKTITTVLSWTALVILIIIGGFLVYYVISANVYASRGEEYKPKVSLYTIISPSMTPKIKVYDVIINVRVDDREDIKVGDIITFTSSSSLTEGYTITHRVVDTQDVDGEIKYKTQGDANNAPDAALVGFDQIHGKTIMRIPQLGRIQFLLASRGGWFFLILIPALGIIIYDILKLFKIVGVKNKVEEIANEEEKPDYEKIKFEQERKEKLKKKMSKEERELEVTQRLEKIKEDYEDIVGPQESIFLPKKKEETDEEKRS